MEFVAFLGKDQETWGQVSALMNRIECDKVILVKDSKSPTFPKNEKTEVINVNTEKPLLDLKKEIMEKLGKSLSKEFEVAVSIASGNGKEHMAFLSALLSIPVGIRFVVYTKEGVKYIN